MSAPAWDAYDLGAVHHDYIGTFDGSATEVAEQLAADGYVGDDPEITVNRDGVLIDCTVQLVSAVEA